MIIIASFIAGLFIGSFLNVIIHRLDTGESAIFRRSHCPLCFHELSWRELVPVISFIIQKARCRSCKGRISWQYPLVEIATGMLLALAAYYVLRQFPFASYSESILFPASFLWIIVSGLLVIFVYDLKHYIIPDGAVAALCFATLLAEIFGVWHFGLTAVPFALVVPAISWEDIIAALGVGTISATPFAAISIGSRGAWMGLGDAKLAFFMGLLLGAQKVVLAIFLGVVLGAVAGLALIVLGKKSMKSQIPFGPFLITGTFIALFWGKNIIAWYGGLVGF